jgi:hypothetical protein
VVLAVLAVGSVAASAVANTGRFALVCVDGKMEARRGSLLPGRMKPLPDPLFVPLTVPPALCRNSEHGSRRALERAYIETAIASVDAAIAAGSAEDLQRSLASLELMLGSAGEHLETSGLERRRRALLLARLRSEVEQARTARQRAMSRIEQAREAGLDDPLVDQLERELRGMEPTQSDERDENPTPPPPTNEEARSEERAL